jgi:nitrite reductase/ring-hydroxylating ferredoxin subunit
VTNEALSRRNALAGAATVGIGLPLLAACGGDSSDAAPDSSAGDSPSAGASSSGTTLGAAADVPVGGGTVFPDAKIVVTQPTEGQFKGFSAICTHQGCPVKSVEDGTINCPCHGSKFSIEDGSPQAGPATKPLGEVGVDVKGGEIAVA